MRLGRVVALVALAGLATPLFAQVDTAAAQKKALARRAAEADAYRKLAEAIKGLQINSQTFVRDFVAESDTISASMDTFIRGVRLGDPTWYEDGSCEVPAEVTVAKVIQELKEIHTRHYKGDRVTGTDIEQMKQSIKKDIIKVVGMGAPREDLPPDLPGGVADQLGGPPASPKPALPELWIKIGPQARMMADRAAELDAKRKLLERIRGLRIDSRTLVKDFVTEFDSIDAQASGMIVGATIVKRYYHFDEPIVEVTVSVPVESVITVVKEFQSRSVRGDDVKGLDISQVSQSIKSQTFEATGMGIPPQRFMAKVEAVTQVQYPDWATSVIRATGSGVAPADKAGTAQGKLLAARAAELDAKRKLVEQVQGLAIRSDTKVQDFVAQYDDIQTHMNGVLVGSTVEKTMFQGDGSAEVTVSVPGMEIWEIISQRIKISQR